MDKFEFDICGHHFRFSIEDDKSYKIVSEYNEMKYEGNSFMKPIGAQGILAIKKLLAILAECDSFIDEKCEVNFIGNNMMLTIPTLFGEKIIVTLKKEEITDIEDLARKVSKLERKVEVLQMENITLKNFMALSQKNLSTCTVGFRNSKFYIEFSDPMIKQLADLQMRHNARKVMKEAFDIEYNDYKENLFDVINARGIKKIYGGVGVQSNHNYHMIFKLDDALRYSFNTLKTKLVNTATFVDGCLYHSLNRKKINKLYMVNAQSMHMPGSCAKSDCHYCNLPTVPKDCILQIMTIEYTPIDLHRVTGNYDEDRDIIHHMYDELKDYASRNIVKKMQYKCPSFVDYENMCLIDSDEPSDQILYGFIY
jgi:hypothetical protein